jgi:hypothetical protein
MNNDSCQSKLFVRVDSLVSPNIREFLESTKELFTKIVMLKNDTLQRALELGL